ncbi:MalY/PatB family protein [Lactococcus termiticola]|uniref:cysteine-S-conjugate beta-lyase n=1 Tax=Lactococcus termiticola TaxID=2169526 RepID=A0A2R5HKL9_9LACT|nr:MalY/PatB family protein [Lactococcus termiticola]GBG97141.1 cystathionine beta-lyase [Lactococcus termiticola]
MNFDEIIDRRNTYCTQWDYIEDRFGEADLLPFTISDTDFAVPEPVSRKLLERLQHPIFGYTRWKHPHFKQAVKGWFDKRFDLDINEDWILYSPAVIYSLAQLIELKSAEGEGVIMQTPAYDAFFKTIKANGRQCVENPLIYEDGSYSIDFDGLEALMADENNKILLLCSPHNPTGRVWTSTELERLIQLCETYDVFLISDEIHMDILRKDKKHHPILEICQKNVALLSSASKTFNFPGLVFSYLLIPDEALRLAFSRQLKEKDGLSSTSILGMEATITAYQEADSFLDELNAYIGENQKLVRAFLEEHLPEIKLVPPEASYLLWLDVSQLGFSMAELQENLIKVGKVAIMDGGLYGDTGRDFIRLNIGCSKEKLQQGLEGLLKSITALKNS